MRVLHLDAGRTMRGGQHQALALAEELGRMGVECLLAAPRGSPLLEAARQQRVPAAALDPLALRRMAPRFDLAHCHDARSHTLAALLWPKPFAVSRRVDFPVGTHVFSRWKYRRAALFLAVSEAVRRRLLEAGLPPDRIAVVPDGVPLPARASTLAGGIITPAWADPRKGAALIRRAGVEVRFSEDLLRDLGEARALVYISESEGLGSAALLALAHGVPVIASRVGGLPEIVIDGVTGILVDNDPADIAAAVARLAGDRGLAARLGAAGRRMVEERFTIERMAAATLEAYRRVLS
ncbi:MAG: glycosyltransferase family 4 protein [Bryobacteraceae bacterium]|nr:glycosyltransferase family 4 protein [Bryobacteraceae bacterium]MCX7604006.1 glycosyltransferase family 4 protein [Bryobacteraceae bacterium]